MRSPFIRSTVASFVLTAFVASSNAHAYGYLTTTGTTAMIVVVVMRWDQLTGKDQNAAKRVAQTYLRENSVQLARDLTLGDGATVNDLAVAFHVSPAHEGAFRNVLAVNGSTLLAAARSGETSPDEAARFFMLLHDTVSANADLRADMATIGG